MDTLIVPKDFIPTMRKAGRQKGWVWGDQGQGDGAVSKSACCANIEAPSSNPKHRQKHPGMAKCFCNLDPRAVRGQNRWRDGDCWLHFQLRLHLNKGREL